MAREFDFDEDAFDDDMPVDGLVDLDELDSDAEGDTSDASGAARNKAAAQEPVSDRPEWQKGTVIDRRVFSDRRDVRDPRGGAAESAGEDATGLERRRGKGRRLSDFSRRAQEGEMTPEQFLFLMAIDEFKKANTKTFPTWTDVLEIIRLLGYRKTMPSELTLRRAEDWREMPTAAANVRPRNWAKRKAA